MARIIDFLNGLINRKMAIGYLVYPGSYVARWLYTLVVLKPPFFLLLEYILKAFLLSCWVERRRIDAAVANDVSYYFAVTQKHTHIYNNNM